MNVTVSVFGKFHAFYLAEQLHRRGHLERIITTYPRYAVERRGVPRHLIDSHILYELMLRTWVRMPLPLRRLHDAAARITSWYDRTAAGRLPANTDIFVGWSSFCERSLLRATAEGAVAIVERGSAHIAYQRDILAEEYEMHGVRATVPHPAIVAREMREYELAQYISVPSSFAEWTFVDAGFAPEKLIRVPYGVDLSEFSTAPRRDQTFRLVYAGAMSLRKGVHYLLQAFAGLRLPDAELWLIGTLTAEIEPFFRRYEGWFRHIPQVPQAHLRSLYDQCSAFALCSIEDGFGMVLLQAMAVGLPIICTVNTGGPDVIEQGVDGFVVPIRDVEALQERILQLYESRERRQEMGRSARRKVETQFTWDDYGTRIVDSYQRILADQETRPDGSGDRSLMDAGRD